MRSDRPVSAVAAARGAGLQSSRRNTRTGAPRLPRERLPRRSHTPSDGVSMPLHRWRLGVSWAFAALLLLAAAPPAHALRIVTYNLLQYPNVAFPARQPHFRTIM